MGAELWIAFSVNRIKRWSVCRHVVQWEGQVGGGGGGGGCEVLGGGVGGEGRRGEPLGPAGGGGGARGVGGGGGGGVPRTHMRGEAHLRS